MFYCFFENLAKWTTAIAGSSPAFMAAIILVVGWFISGFYFNFSDSHSLVINTITTIVTFLMVFLIQRTQNKDSMAIQMKLNELIAAHSGASNKILNIEDLSEGQILDLQKRYRRLAEKTQHEDEHPLMPHSIEEIEPIEKKLASRHKHKHP